MGSKNYRLLPLKLQELRKNKQLSQKDIAEAIGISKAMYCRIESGERLMQQSQIEMFADFLNANIEELRSLCLADKMNASTHEYSNSEISNALNVLKNEH
ncbi:MAG: helix-turn-helix transcriptional regulator [Prevotella sp.]|nr:helix-turn-helix transcriptional regulator [Prevotella sp.]